MSAETLRRAGALMRKNAEAARAGRWLSKGGQVFADWHDFPRHIAVCSGSIDVGNASNATHIAGMHPAVALAVADWLDGCATRRGATSDARIEHDPEEQDWYLPALAVANAYLSEATP